jgi:hypothetical protein
MTMSKTDDEQQARIPGVPSEDTGSNRRLIALLGGIVFLFGLGFGLYLTVLVMNAEAAAAFSMSASEMPTKSLRNLICPPLLARHETRNVTATIFNPRDRVTGYSVHVFGTVIGDDGRHTGPVVLSDPNSSRARLTSVGVSDLGYCSTCTSKTAEVTIPSGETVDLTWRVGLEDEIRGEQIALQVYAFGRGDDRTYTLGFHAWDFSYQGTCGITIINLLGLTGGQASGLSLLSMLLGGIVWLYGRRPLGRLGYIGAILGSLLWLILLWRLMISIGTINFLGTTLSVLTCLFTPLLVLALLVVLVIPLVRRS